ncbi:MAG: ThuA domain-containing protein [Planctomycetaceae bacterium]|nr:ThuA domain-containing protein [Planctomycetaceae bacterium]
MTFHALRSLGVLLLIAFAAQAADPVKPLHALLVTGGCCHDYAKQKDLLKAGIEARAHVNVDIHYNEDKSTKAVFSAYAKPNWAEGYDVVIHDECSADVKDMPYVENILKAHREGVAAVNLHCAMHCYRTGTEDWFQFVGIQSSRHGPQKPIEVTYVEREHDIVKGLANWTTINEELYNNLKLFETARPLARGKQDTGKAIDDAVVVWTNQYGKGRVFSTTLGHNNDTVGDARYLDLVTRGLLWSCDKLNASYLKTSK